MAIGNRLRGDQSRNGGILGRQMEQAFQPAFRTRRDRLEPRVYVVVPGMHFDSAKRLEGKGRRRRNPCLAHAVFVLPGQERVGLEESLYANGVAIHMHHAGRAVPGNAVKLIQAIARYWYQMSV